ncbi:MAG: ATP-binding cassette domain-containing protein [bacterium]
METVINVQNLTRTFGKIKAVDHVNFKIYRGEVFGFLGPNGAGKTTTVRMLTGVIEPTYGTAAIQDHDIRKEPLLSRAHLSVVPEEANVYLDLSVWQNIMLMAELHGVARNQKIKEAERLLDLLDLKEKKKQKARELSKGLRQRLMLCAALVTGPDILFLDEPTSGLDVQSARLIRQIISDLNRNGLTVFLTTHNMDEAGEMCSRIAIINKGRIATVDTPEKLKSTISSRQFVEVRFRYTNPDHNELKALRSVLQIELEKKTYRLYTKTPGKVLTEVVHLAENNKLEIMHMSTCKPTLEDVYLYFTSEGNE